MLFGIIFTIIFLRVSQRSIYSLFSVTHAKKKNHSNENKKKVDKFVDGLLKKANLHFTKLR